jgi:hypothetical protein
MGQDCVSEPRPPTGLLFIARMIYEFGEPRWNDIGRENRTTSRKTCSSVSVYHKTHMDSPGHEPGPPWFDAGD